MLFSVIKKAKKSLKAPKVKSLVSFFSRGVPEVRVHPLFIGLGAALVLSGAIEVLIANVIAVIVHELGHSAEAFRHGYRLKKITLYPYGGVIDGETISREHVASVSIMGPISNIVLALLLTVVKFYGVDNSFLSTLINANVAIFAFNLLPAFPLDGARIVTSICNNKIRAVKILRIVGICCSLAIFGLFIFSAFGRINFTLGIIAIFLFLGSVSEGNLEIFRHVAGLSPLVKDYDGGVEVRTVAVSSKIPVSRLSSMLKPRSVTHFSVVDDKGAEIGKINEDELFKIIMTHSSEIPIVDALDV